MGSWPLVFEYCLNIFECFSLHCSNRFLHETKYLISPIKPLSWSTSWPCKANRGLLHYFFCAFSLVVQCFSCMLWKKKQNINLKPNAGFAFQDISTLFIFINTYLSESGDVAALLQWIKSHAVHSLSTRFSRSPSWWKPQPCWPHRCILWQFQCFFSPPAKTEGDPRPRPQSLMVAV